MNPLDSFRNAIAKFLISRIPLSRRTILNRLLAEQPLSGQFVDISTVHSILDGTDVGNTRDYFALCDYIVLSDSHMQGEIAKRKLALLGDQLMIGPADKKKPEDVAAAGFCQELIDGLPSFLTGCASLLDGSIWPLGIVEKVFRPAKNNPKLTYEVDSLTRV